MSEEKTTLLRRVLEVICPHCGVTHTDEFDTEWFEKYPFDTQFETVVDCRNCKKYFTVINNVL